jgi:ankyrin repeat protein
MGGTPSKDIQKKIDDNSTLSSTERRRQLHLDAYNKLANEPKFLLNLLQDETLNASINPNMKFGTAEETFLSQIASVYKDSCGEEYKKCTRLLIKHGAKVNVRDKHGNTPLHISIRTPENTSLTKVFLENGADVTCKNIDGKTPLHYAVSILYKVDWQDPDSFTKTNIENVLLLVQYGAKINEKDNENVTPFELANESKLAELLIFYGADISTNKGNQGLKQKYQGNNPCYILANCETQPDIKKHIDNYLKLGPQEGQEKIDGLICMAKKLNNNETSRNAYQNFISVVKETFPHRFANINNSTLFDLVNKEKTVAPNTASLNIELPKSKLAELEEPKTPPQPKS